MKTLITLSMILLSSLALALPPGPLEIIQIGHPTLRAQAVEIDHPEIGTPEFQKLVDDMIKTMKNASGVGLAAPQVNKSIRMFVMQSWPNVPLTVVINPKIEYLEAHGQQKSTEGCLSIPGRSLKVTRYKRVHMSYFNRKGEYISEELKGFKAIIAQHEYDHLNGVLIVDLVEAMNSKINFEEWLKAPLM